MAKVTLLTIENLQNETSALGRLNSNFSAIATAIETILSRDGASPNQMLANIDMNGRRIINLPAPVAATDAARFIDIAESVVRAEEAAAAAEESEIAAEEAETNTTALYENFIARYDGQYDLSFFVDGLMAEDEILFSVVLIRPTVFPTNFAASLARAGTPAGATETVISIQKNGVEFGTLTFAVASSQGSFAGTETSFVEGDVLRLVAPDPVDAALSDLSITIRGARIT